MAAVNAELEAWIDARLLRFAKDHNLISAEHYQALTEPAAPAPAEPAPDAPDAKKAK